LGQRHLGLDGGHLDVFRGHLCLGGGHQGFCGGQGLSEANTNEHTEPAGCICLEKKSEDN
jgi:hypothetical protein